MNTLLIAGFAVFVGTITGNIFKKFKIPQVVGYIIVGVLIGKSFLHIFEGDVVESLTPLVNFTLGIIGCVIGAELKGGVFKKFGKSIYTILIFEGVLAFVFVTIFVTLITKKLYLGLILGAIASATDPASTINVLWEYKAKGPLTRTLTSIVALDDGLALIIYSLVSVFSKSMIMKQHFSWMEGLVVPIWEIIQCLILGAIAGGLVVKTIKHIKEEELVLSFILGVVACCVGLSTYLHLDLILTSMALGMTIANIIPDISEKLFGSFRKMTTSLYILFFVVVGAQLDVHIFLNVSIFSIVLVYLLARSFGKIFGAMTGGVLTKAEKNVTKFSGLCLFTQGGVAMGLALSINHNLANLGGEGQQIGLLVVNVVAATTFVVQLVGPLFVKLAITRAGERGKDITEADLMKALIVDELMDPSYPIVYESTPFKQILDIFSNSPYTQFPVVDGQRKLTGVINIDSIKNSLIFDGTGSLLLGNDLKQVFSHSVTLKTTLQDAREYMNRFRLGFLPVVDQEGVIKGCFDRRMHQKFISTKLFELQSEDN